MPWVENQQGLARRLASGTAVALVSEQMAALACEQMVALRVASEPVVTSDTFAPSDDVLVDLPASVSLKEEPTYLASQK